jgi:cytochrome c-type biogenesis protein CcmH
MMIFWMVVALLIVAALLFVLPPLITRTSGGGVVDRSTLNISVYRDQLAELERDRENDVITQEQYEQGRLELERRLLDDVPEDNGSGQGHSAGDAAASAQGSRKTGRIAAVIIGIAIPVFTISVYQWLGMPQSISPATRAAISTEASNAKSPSAMSDQVNAMVTQLAQRLKDNPDDPEGWAMLGRSYLVLGRPDDAVKSYEKAIALSNNDPNIMVDYADALAMASGEQSLEGKPMELIQQALTLDPNNQKGLWLAGTAAYEKGNFQQALDYWRKLYGLLPKDSQDALVMQGNIKEAESMIAGRANVAAATQQNPDATQALDAQVDRHVTGVVKLDEKLYRQVNETDTVFVFARASEGPRMPLAVMRAQVKDLPLDFSLDDSMAINPAMTISKYPEVIVVARISRSGNATPQSGDVQGMSRILRVGLDEADVTINEVIP